MKSKCIVYLIKKVAETRVMERSIYHNYPLMVFYEPSCFRELEHIVRLSRKRAEVILTRKREPIPQVMKFFVQRVGRGKGIRKADFVVVFPEIGVNERGEIDYMVAPNKEINPMAYNVYIEYQLSRYIKTRDKKYLMRVMGIPVYDRRPEPVINMRWPKYHGKDITDLIAEDIGWLFGPPKKEKKPPWEF
ncbi:MAG: hypothetical protein QXS29_06040 [Nitrososphaeria archaeon]